MRESLLKSCTLVSTAVVNVDSFDLAIKRKFEQVERTREDMHLYQEECVEFLMKNSFSALFIDLGMGKTISSLTVIAELLESLSTDEKILVIGPVKVIADTWPTEVALWKHVAWMNYTIIRGEGSKHETPEQERERLARASTQLHFINREMVEWLVYFWKGAWPYRIVFVDESSSFKDHTSKRFEALAKVRNSTGLITRLHIMTATPAAETYVHLFPQIYLLDRGARLGKNITAYRNEHFIYNKYKMKYVIRPSSEETILRTLADICLVMKKKDYLNPAEPTVQLHRVKLDAPHLDLIKELERKFIVTLPDGTEIEAKTAAMLSSMMLQMASGTVYETLLVEDFDTDDLKKVKKVHHIHDHKIKALKEIVEEAQTQGTPLLVAYHFQSSLAKLRKAFPKATVMDKEGKCIKAWNAGKFPIMFIHPQSAGHGLNLQYGGHILIFFDLIYSLENYLQTIGRLDRQGQKNPVLVKMLVAEGTRDEIVAKALFEKKDAQEKLFAILKRLIAKWKKKQALLK